MLSWLTGYFYKSITYSDFIYYIRNDTICVKDRIHYSYTHLHTFEKEIHDVQNKSDLYYISDLLVMETVWLLKTHLQVIFTGVPVKKSNRDACKNEYTIYRF